MGRALRICRPPRPPACPGTLVCSGSVSPAQGAELAQAARPGPRGEPREGGQAVGGRRLTAL